MVALLFGLVALMMFVFRVKYLQSLGDKLNNDIHARSRQMQVLTEIMSGLTSAGDYEEFGNRLFAHLGQIIPLDKLEIGFLDPEQETLVFHFSKSKARSLPQFEVNMSDTGHPAVHVLISRTEVVLQQPEDWQQRFPSLGLHREGFQISTVIQPIISGDQAIGCICVQTQHKNAYDSAALEFIRVFSHCASLILAHGKLAQELDVSCSAVEGSQQQTIQPVTSEVSVVKEAPEAVSVETSAELKPVCSSTEQSSADDDELAPASEVINFREGLAIAQGNQDLYRRILQNFIQCFGDFDHKFSELRQQNRTSEAFRLAHSLKGAAGNIGAPAVQVAAQQLEQACNGSIDSMDNAQQQLRSDLQPLYRAIHNYLEHWHGQGKTATDADQVCFEEQDLCQLIRRIEVSDTAAIEQVNQLQYCPQWADHHSEISQAADALSTFDFDRAASCLRKLQHRA